LAGLGFCFFFTRLVIDSPTCQQAEPAGLVKTRARPYVAGRTFAKPAAVIGLHLAVRSQAR
jgi:hypothetical protein